MQIAYETLTSTHSDYCAWNLFKQKRNDIENLRSHNILPLSYFVVVIVDFGETT